MVRNIVIVGGSSHPQLTSRICAMLGIPAAQTILSKFAVGETRVEIQDSVRGKDVYVVQSGSGRVNDNLMELLITISACKTASAKTVTAVMPLFPYSRQPDLPYYKTGAPLSKAPSDRGESRPETPLESHNTSPTEKLTNGLDKELSRVAKERAADCAPNGIKPKMNGKSHPPTPLRRSETSESLQYAAVMEQKARENRPATPSLSGGECNPFNHSYKPNSGYRQWVAQAGTLVADLLSCAGADHIITMDLHDAQYQGFFDIPVDNLYARPLLKRYIQRNIPLSEQDKLVIVSPDAGGAKRATALADSLQMEFALIHKVNNPNDHSEHYPPAFVSSWADEVADNMDGTTDSNPIIQSRSNPRSRREPTMMLVGDLKDKIAIIVDDLADTSVTITRAAKLVKEKGATKVYALVTHAVLSGDAIERINDSEIDRLVVTNTVPQDEHIKRCPKLEVLDVAGVFAEAIRRVHHGESISVLFQFD